VTYKTRLAVFALEAIPLSLVILTPMFAQAGVLASLASALDSAVTVTYAAAPTVENAQDVPLLRAALHTDPNPAKGGGDVIIEEGALVPDGALSDGGSMVSTKTPGGEISLYTVREGDTLSQIAAMFDVSKNTILWANGISDANLIKPGDELLILPITGIQHVVKDGETLASIAKKYGGADDNTAAVVDDIIAYNRLASESDVHPGQTIVIPVGTEESEAPAKGSSSKPASSSVSSGTTVIAKGAGSSGFIAPLAHYVETQGIHGYNAVDLAAPLGTPIRAAAAGTVIVAKNNGAWNGGYGNYVVIKHAGGVQTLYAHMSSEIVSVGETLAQGDTVGYIGVTGRTTGPHVHFEVRGAANPF
jgi:murein DD-endopeptidase MepM/ murein hydrolase activator NlpD